MANFRTLITVPELADIIGDVRVFDCRFSLADPDAGRAAYDAEHLPGALHADLDKNLSSAITPETGRHPLPDRGTFAETVRDWGIRNHDQVVIYDDAPGAQSARLWWMLRWLGHANVAVLEGGFPAWQAAGQPVTTDVPTFERSGFEASEPITRTVTAADLPSETHCVIDARDRARFRGEVEPIDPVAGHIPGAVCRPFTDNVSDGRFADTSQIASDFNALTGGRDVICYCGSGVTAAHNILAMVHAGLPEPALYPGSWSEWIRDGNRPVATGD